ncbi:MAG TPA: oligosaccharide flippase family protein [Burkholderiaceae bacterium]|nr:oligosaccharide flippase family protein [Burkholderiaceae bacterium]
MRLFSGALASQAIVSAASFLVGLILIRHQSAELYGYYVLVTTAMLLLGGLQFSYLGPTLIIRLANRDLAGRRDAVGGMLREQRKWIPVAGGAAAYLDGVLWWSGVLDDQIALMVAAAILAAMATMQREFFRMVLLAYRRPLDVLKADAAYVVLLVGGAFASSLTPVPGIAAVLTLAFATLVGGLILGRLLKRHEGWNLDGERHILREIAPIGGWALMGSAVHWLFSQGYNYVVVGILDARAVALVASMRLLMMPVNLMSQGISQILLPTASHWLRDHGPARLLQRLTIVAASVCALALVYSAIVWEMREWIFDEVLRRHDAHQGRILLLWSAVFVLMALRDQLAHFLTVRAQMKQLSSMTLVSAAISLMTTYAATVFLGVSGAVIGVLVGELINVLGIAVMATLQSRRPSTDEVPAAPPTPTDARATMRLVSDRATRSLHVDRGPDTRARLASGDGQPATLPG